MNKYKLSSDGTELAPMKFVEKVLGFDLITRALGDKTKLLAN